MTLFTASILLPAVAALAQGSLQVAYEVDKSRGTQTQIVGSVSNAGAADAIDVSVTAEALDRNGHVVASGITYVDARIARGDSRSFTAVIPAVPNAVRYRVTATSARPFGGWTPSGGRGGGGQAP